MLTMRAKGGKPRASHHLLSFLSPTCSRANVFHPRAAPWAVAEAKHLWNKSSSIMLQCIGRKRCKFPKTHIFQNINCQGKAFAGIAAHSWSLLISLPPTHPAPSASLPARHSTAGTREKREAKTHENEVMRLMCKMEMARGRDIIPCF